MLHIRDVWTAQALAKTKAMQDKLVVDRPQWAQEKTMQVLGVSIRARPSKNTAAENQRIAAAVNRSKLLGCLPVSIRRKLELYKVPKASGPVWMDQQISDANHSLMLCSTAIWQK